MLPLPHLPFDVFRGRVRFDGICALLAASVFLAAPSPGRGATLSGSFTALPPGTTVNLAGEGKLDWGHWGQPTEWTYNHKYGMAQQITYSFVSDADYVDGPYLMNTGMSVFSWTNGTPTRLATNTPNGAFIVGDKLQGNTPTGFQLQCLADTAPRTLKVYVANAGAPATFSASLSGASTYTDSSLNGSTGPSNGVYTLNFQASSPGQTLVVNFKSTDTSANMVLQAASLAGTNAPPTVAITTPADGVNFSAPANFSVSAAAADSDGSVTNLTLLRGSTVVGQSPSGALTVAMNNQPAGAYNFVAVATDNRGLSLTSFPVTVYITINGGTLAGSVGTPPTTLDLTAEGRTDWAHWGLASPSSFDHKAGVLQRIPNVTLLHATASALNQYADNLTAYSWTGGTPTAAAGGSTTGIFLYGTNNPPGGFQLTVPATNTLRWLKVYVGLYAAQARLDAWLSDFSAVPYSDASLSAAYQNAYAVYTFAFASTNPGTSLNLSWTPVTIYDANYGNLTWQAATLAEPPLLGAISNRTVAVGTGLAITNAASDPYGDPLVFSLGAGAAAGAGIDATSGIFTWTPTQEQLGSNAFLVIVTDSSSPPLSTSRSFTVTVVPANPPPAPVLSVISPAAGNAFGLSFHAEAGASYKVVFVESLTSTNWQELTNFLGTGADVIVMDPSFGSAQRFYRVQVR
jgi:hypothetical protein